MSYQKIDAERVAVAQFFKDQPNANLQNFEIKTEDRDDVLRVNICPRLSEKPPLAFGGSNEFGDEVNYYVDKKTNVIIKRTFAR